MDEADTSSGASLTIPHRGSITRRRIYLFIISTVLAIVSLAVAGAGAYQIWREYNANPGADALWPVNVHNRVTAATDAIDTGVALTLAAVAAIAGAVTLSSGVLHGQVVLAVLGVTIGLQTIIDYAQVAVNEQRTMSKQELWTTVGVLIGGSLLVYAVVTQVIVASVGTIMLRVVRRRATLKCRPVALAMSALLTVSTVVLLVASVLSFVYTQNDIAALSSSQPIFSPLLRARSTIATHHMIVAVVLFGWCIQQLAGTLAHSRAIVMQSALMASVVLYTLLSQLDTQAELVYRLHGTAASVSNAWVYYVMVIAGLVTELFLLIVIPFFVHSSL